MASATVKGVSVMDCIARGFDFADDGCPMALEGQHPYIEFDLFEIFGKLVG